MKEAIFTKEKLLNYIVNNNMMRGKKGEVVSMQYLSKELKEAYDYDCAHCANLDFEDNLINVSDVLKAHYILADYFTDPSSGEEQEHMLVGVRSYDLLASALGRQKVEYGGKRKYTDKVDIASTLFYGLVKNHAFHDGNKRTALLILIYQLQKYGYYPKNSFKEYEKLVVATADNSLPFTYKNEWKKMIKNEDPEIKTISYIVRKMSVRKDNSYHMNITTKDFCQRLENLGVRYRVDGNKIKFERNVRIFLRIKKLSYTVNFYGWTRPVQGKMARDIANALDLMEEYPSFASWVDKDNNIYRIIRDYEVPLKRLKDK